MTLHLGRLAKQGPRTFRPQLQRRSRGPGAVEMRTPLIFEELHLGPSGRLV